MGGWTLDPVRKALICQRAENQFVGVNCGILDQYTSCLGREGCALLLDCRDLSSRPASLAEGVQVVICDTRSHRELAGSEYGQRQGRLRAGRSSCSAFGHFVMWHPINSPAPRRRFLPA